MVGCAVHLGQQRWLGDLCTMMVCENHGPMSVVNFELLNLICVFQLKHRQYEKHQKNLESQCIFRNFNCIQYVHPIGSWRIGKLTDTWFISTNNWFCCGCCCCVVAVRGSIRNLVVQSSEFREELQKKRNNLRCGCCGDGFGWNKFGTCSHERCCCWGSRHL